MKLGSKLFRLIGLMVYCLYVPISIADTVYDASTRTPGTDFFVYFGINDETNSPPPSSLTPIIQISSSNYSAVSSLDGSSYAYSVPSNGKLGHLRFKVIIDEPVASLTQINFEWHGSGNNSFNKKPDGAEFYIWNYNASAYELVDSTSSSSLVTLSGSLTSSLSNYLGGITNNTLTFVVITAEKRNGNKSYVLSTDYFNVNTVGPDASADHFQLTLSNTGLFCLAHPITLSAYDSLGSILTSYDQQITLDTQSGNGTWSLASGSGTFVDVTADDGLATYLFNTADAGTASFSLSYQQGSTPINIDAYQSTNTGIRDDDTEGDISFSPSGFIITEFALTNPPSVPINTGIGAKTAGTNFPLFLTAYGQTETDPICGVIETYVGNKDLYFWINYSDPITGFNKLQIDNTQTAESVAGSSQVINFINGQASINVKYKDVGKIVIQAKDIEVSGDILGSTEGFVVKPANLIITPANANSLTGNPAAVDAAGDIFKKAGETFAVEVSVIDSEGDITPNYGYENIPETISISSTTLVAPSTAIGGRNGSLNNGVIENGSTGFSRFSAGIFRGDTFAFDEVGIIKLTAEVGDLSYLNEGPVTGAESGNIGRFTPWRFDVIDNTPLFLDALGPSCSLTYQNQPFGYDASAGLYPIFTITAINKANGATHNYGGDFWKYTSDLSDRSYNNQATGTVAGLSFDLAGATVSISEYSDLTTGPNGQWTMSITNEALIYTKNAVTPVAADAVFDADVDLALTALSLTDSDGICHDLLSDGSCDDYMIEDITGASIHYGRLAMDNGYGSELSPVIVDVRTESWNGLAFVTNTIDYCSDDITEWSGFSLSDFTNNLNSGETTTSFAGLVSSLTPGSGLLTLSAPGAGNDGSVRVTLNGPSWLQYDYDGDGSAEDVRAVVVFGIWPGRAPIILIRESYR